MSASIHKKKTKEHPLPIPFWERHFFSVIVLPFFLASFLLYAFVSIQLQNRFLTFGLDLGYFDEAIWKISQFTFPYSGIGCIWLLEDHFQPILYLVAPFYWLWSDVRMLLIIQSLVMVGAAVPLYWLGLRISNHRWFSLAVCFAYLFFIGTQWAILNEYHQVTFAPLGIAVAYWAVETKQRRLLWGSVLLLLLIKEDLSLLVASIGMGLITVPAWRRTGIALGVVGAAWFFLLTKLIMPALSVKGVYAHFSHLDFGPLGQTPSAVITTLLRRPWLGVVVLFWPLMKLQTLLKSLATFSFLPLLAPLFILIPLGLDFVFRFVYAGPQVTKWLLVNHHAAMSGMLLAIAVVYAGKRYHRFYGIFAVLLFLSTLALAAILHAPLNSVAKRQFWTEEQWVRDNREVVRHVPTTASVAAQNNLLPHLAHRDVVYRLPYGLNSDYMVVDLHDGPNKYAPLTYEQMVSFVADLLASKRYSVVYQQGEAMVLHRNFTTDITKSPWYGDTRYCYYSREQ